MTQKFFVTLHQFDDVVKKKSYLKTSGVMGGEWTGDINEAEDQETYPRAENTITLVGKPGDILQIEKFYVV